MKCPVGRSLVNFNYCIMFFFFFFNSLINEEFMDILTESCNLKFFVKQVTFVLVSFFSHIKYSVG